ncbi:MAG: tail fiber domain-containing protein [Melioribacteraceae bacterium]
MFTYLNRILLIFICLCVTIIAQEEKNIKSNDDVKKKINSVNNPNSTEAAGQTISFKNETNNAILTITDEGSNAASINLPPLSAIGNSSAKLYNLGGNLYWNGNALGSGVATQLNDLSDAKYDGTSLFLGEESGNVDDGGNNNTAVGRSSLSLNSTGTGNTASGNNALHANLSGSQNTAAGQQTLYNNIDGGNNSAFGQKALLNNTTGDKNTACGTQTLYYNQAGNNGVAVGYQSQFYANSTSTEYTNYNTSVGYQSLLGSSNHADNTGNYNSAFGYQALLTNTTGSWNTANGYQALYSNTTGTGNTANGYQALYSNTTGSTNSANGYQALYSNTIGTANTANGLYALQNNTTGTDNTANGSSALHNNTEGDYNTAIGSSSLGSNIEGDYNTAIGYLSGPSSASSYDNSTALGFYAIITASNQIRLGNSSVTSIGGYAAWSNLSDGRFKRNIKENISGLDFILGLRPVSFNMDYNAVSEKLGENKHFENKEIKGTDGLATSPNETDAEAETYMREAREKKSTIRQVGFIAQEVEELVNKLGVDFSGVEVPENEQSMYRLRYSEFVVPLVKAVQEQQTIIQNLTKRIEELESRK